MLHRIASLIAPAAAAAFLSAIWPAPSLAQQPPKEPASVLDFTVKDIDGNAVPLSKFKGKVLLFVNTASQCGNTPQYKQLQEIYQKYKDQGLEVLAFPANEFGTQEPGTDKEIKQFCSTNYKVSFPLFSKIVVKGKGIHPLYAHLTSAKTNPRYAGDVSWNFAKFLVDRKGEVVGRFNPEVKPDTPEVISAIEKALAQK